MGFSFLGETLDSCSFPWNWSRSHTQCCHETEIAGGESPDVCSPLEKKGKFSLPHFLTDLKPNQKVIFDGKAFFYREHNFPHWFSKPKVVNRVMTTELQNILAHVGEGKELLATTFGCIWGKHKNIMGRLQLHVPGKFDSLKQNITKQNA